MSAAALERLAKSTAAERVAAWPLADVHAPAAVDRLARSFGLAPETARRIIADERRRRPAQ